MARDDVEAGEAAPRAFLLRGPRRGRPDGGPGEGGAAGRVRPPARAVARTLWLALVTAPLTVAIAPVHIALSLLALPRRPERRLERFWFGAVLQAAGVRVRIRGRERVQEGRSYVIMANHRSWLDVAILHLALGDRDVRWIGKKEIVRVPLFGWAFAASRHIAIDRGDLDRAVRAIRRAAEVGGGGVSIVMFPEGTRSPGEELLPFKKGGFHLAVDAGLPILPVALTGTERVMRKRSWTVRPGQVDVAFCEPVLPGPGGKAALPQLIGAVRERIEAALRQLHPKEGP